MTAPAAERYGDLALVGAGGLGDVFRATDAETARHVAVKVLHDVSDSSAVWHRVRRELTALVALSGHPHVVQLLDLTTVDGVPAIVMEYAPHGSVARFVDDGGEPGHRAATLPEIVLIARHAAAALVVAHEHEIVHRDVKPHNLLIADDGRVMLCDFGVAALARTARYRTRTDALSLRYASPEDLDDDADVTVATDVYSLGATLLHLAHGAPPTLKERLAPWRPPDAAADAGRRTLDGIIARCLHPEAHHRPTAPEVLADLERLDWSLDDRIAALEVADWTPVEPVAPTPARAVPDDTRGRSFDHTLVPPPRQPPERPAPVPPGRRGWWLIALVAAVGVLAGAVGWWLDRGRPDGPSVADWAAEPAGEPATEPAGDMVAAPSVVARPSGLIDIRDVTWPFGRLGECLVQTSGSELVPVGCDEPHDLQRTAIAELDVDRFGAAADFDATAVDDELQVLCDRSLTGFVGVVPGDTAFSSAFTRPSADTWAAGDRSFQCLVGVRGARTVGDAGADDDLTPDATTP